MKRLCIDCKNLVDKPANRCPQCQLGETAKKRAYGRRLDADPARRASKALRYDKHYRATRREFAALTRHSTVSCARCSKPIAPGEPWHLDHLPDGSLHPSHPLCNTNATTWKRG